MSARESSIFCIHLAGGVMDNRVMPARQGTRFPISKELRLELYQAFRESGVTYSELAQQVAMRAHLKKAPSQTTMRRIIDPNDARCVNASTLLPVIKEMLGLRDNVESMVLHNKDEINLILNYRKILAVNRAVAKRLLRSATDQAAAARRIEKEQDNLLRIAEE